MHPGVRRTPCDCNSFGLPSHHVWLMVLHVDHENICVARTWESRAIFSVLWLNRPPEDGDVACASAHVPCPPRVTPQSFRLPSRDVGLLFTCESSKHVSHMQPSVSSGWTVCRRRRRCIGLIPLPAPMTILRGFRRMQELGSHLILSVTWLERELGVSRQLFSRGTSG